MTDQLSEKNNDKSMNQFILRSGWNGQYATGYATGNASTGGLKTSTTPFRAVMNAGDPLSRTNYACGGTPIQANSNPNTSGLSGLGRLFGGISNRDCDKTNVPPSTTNVKYVYDGSDYTRFKKQQATNRVYSNTSPTVFCINQLGGVGRGRSMFRSNADDVKCVN
jgi:hypothetical protein